MVQLTTYHGHRWYAALDHVSERGVPFEEPPHLPHGQPYSPHLDWAARVQLQPSLHVVGLYQGHRQAHLLA